jgi:hypothetical protein
MSFMTLYLHHLELHDSTQDPIIASIVMLLSGLWVLFSFAFYKVYDVIRILVLKKSRTVIDEEEMLVLMHAMDPVTVPDPTLSATKKQKKMNASNIPLDSIPYTNITHTLKLRNNLLINIYLVASGVFFCVFPLLQINVHAASYFLVVLLAFAAKDSVLRAFKVPECFEQAIALQVHRAVFRLEYATLFALSVLGGILFTATYKIQDISSSPTQWVLIYIACALAPILIWTAPNEHHYIVAFETSVPVACLLAFITLYSVSPILPYLDLIADNHSMWPFFYVVPIVFPLTVVSMMHCVRTGLSIALLLSISVWCTMHTFLEYYTSFHVSIVAISAILCMCAITTLSAWWFYCKKNILVHAIHISETTSFPLTSGGAVVDPRFSVIDEDDSDAEAHRVVV